MKIDEALIAHVAEVARLALTPEEIKRFVPQVKEILEAFSALDEVDTEGVSPSLHPVEIRDVMREDKITKSLSQEEALSQTKHKKDGYFKGPSAV